MAHPEENPLTWKVHPAKERKLATMLTAFAIVVFSVTAGFLMQSVFWGVGCLGFLIVVLNRYFFSTEFTLYDDGITANYPLSKIRIDWSRVRRFLHDEKGGFLSTRAKSSLLDLFQGMPLTFSENATEIVEQIEKRIENEVRST